MTAAGQIQANPAPRPLAPSGESRHATAVEIDGAGVLVEGPSGSGKSALAITLIALGARLVSDDRTRVAPRDGWPWALAPDHLAGVIEARNVGLLRVPHVAGAPVRLVVDMAQAETDRLPHPRTRVLLGQEIACIRRVDAPYFPHSIVALMKGGRWHDG